MKQHTLSAVLVLGLAVATTSTVPAQRRSLTKDLEKPMYEPSGHRQMAQNTWDFGWNLALMLTLRANDAKFSTLDRYEKRCAAAARKLGVRAPTLFRPQGNKVKDYYQAISFVTRGDGPKLAKTITTRHGRRFGAIFEFALKNGLLLLMYSTEDKLGWGRALRTALDRAASDAELPRSVWQSVRGSMEKREAAKTVRGHVLRLDRAMKRHFGSRLEAGPTPEPGRPLERRTTREPPLVVRHLVRPFLTSYPSLSVRDEARYAKAFRMLRSSCFKLGLLLGETGFKIANGEDVASELRRMRAACKALKITLPEFKDKKGKRIADVGRENRISGLVSAVSFGLHVGGPAMARALARSAAARVGAAPFELGLKAALISRVANAKDHQILEQEIRRLGAQSRIPLRNWSALTSLPRSKTRTAVLASVSSSIRSWGR